MLHDAVIGLVFHAVPLAALGHDGGVQDLIGLLLHRGGGFRFGLWFRFRLGSGLVRGVCLRRGRLLLDGRGVGGVRRILRPLAAGAGGCKQQRQGQQQRGKLFHVYSYLLEAVGTAFFLSLVYHARRQKQANFLYHIGDKRVTGS